MEMISVGIGLTQIGDGLGNWTIGYRDIDQLRPIVNMRLSMSKSSNQTIELNLVQLII